MGSYLSTLRDEKVAINQNDDFLTNGNGNASIILNDDVMINILSKLPMESLLRFMYVSKAWRKFISEHSSPKKTPLSTFGLLIDNINPRRINYLPFPWINTPIAIPVFSLSPDKGFYLMDSCNGLLLYMEANRIDSHGVYLVFNPITKQLIRLPLAGKQDNNTCLHGGIAFDPNISRHFKVVCHVRNRGRATLEIFSSETGSWRIADEASPESIKPSPSFAFVNALMYLSFRRHNNILRIDLGRNSFHSISLPMPQGEFIVGKCKERIYCSMCDGLDLRIWMLEENGEDHKWLLKHVCSQISLTWQVPNRRHHTISQFLRPLVFYPDAEIIFIEFINAILYYDFSSRKIVEFYRLDDDELGVYKVFTLSPCPFKILMN